MAGKTDHRASRLTKPTALAPAGVIGAAVALLGAGAAHAIDAGALPQGGTVVGGSAAISRSGSTLTVDQASSRAVIDWRSFDIGSGSRAVFNQPGSSAIAVNRVNAATDPTRIEGALSANGQVWILNPNGVLFGKTATINVAGLLASTANLDPARFMAGDNRLAFTGADHGSVVNEGSITIADNGLAAFVAPSVRNNGLISARVGKVALAAGTTFTLDLAGDRLVELGLGAGQAVVDQSGRIVDEGGVVTLTARSAGQVVDAVINMSGFTSTASAHLAGGEIVLDGGQVQVAGTLDASGTSGGRIAVTGQTVQAADSAVLRADAGVAGNGGLIQLIASAQGTYAGTYSARGGASSGDGGQVETSAAVLHIADGIGVDTRAAAGATGAWTLDPDTLTVGASGAGTIGGGINSEDVTIGASTVVGALATTNVTLQAKTAITINAAIDASANATAHNLRLADQDGGGLTINLNAAIRLAGSGVLSGQGTTVNVGSGALIQNGVDVAAGGARVNVAAGTYVLGSGIAINTAGLTLAGQPGAVIQVPDVGQTDGIDIHANNVTVSGFTITGPAFGQSYLTYAWGSTIPRGIGVSSGVTGFTITGNTISGVRNGILIDGRNSSGVISNNVIDGTKSAISVQYADASALGITGNHEGQFGNEWGLNLHLNGYFDGTTVQSNPGGAASMTVQQALLADAAANGGWSVQDQAYTSSNRTRVTVATTGSLSNQGSALSPLSTIQAGISAVVTGGEIDVMNGTYVIPAGGNYINVNKSLSLIGQSQAGVIIDARGASTYGLRVTAPSDVTLRDFTLWGVTAANSYGLKAEATHNLTIADVTSQGAGKSEFDLNGVVGATLDHLTANGAPVGGGADTAGNGIAFTDSQDIVLTNSATLNNGWGGLALYQTNSPSGYPLQETGITVGASNSFAEANPIYAEDQSSTHDFGTLNIAGFDYLVKSPTNPADVYTWFRRTQQDAIDFAALQGLTTAYVEGYASGVTGNNIFSVGAATSGQVLSIQAAVNGARTGGLINVGAGTYALTSGIAVNTAGVTLNGQPGAVIQVPDVSQTDGIDIHANNVTVSGFTIEGPAQGQSYLTYAWGSTIPRGIAVASGVTGFTITGNTISGVRNGILIDGRNSSGVISNNVIDGTKSAISVQYTDASALGITGNREGQFGNEWGLNLHLNGYFDGTTVQSNPGGAASITVQQALLADAAANSGWAVQDQAYASSNRTRVTVDATGSGSNQGSALAPLSTIQAGISAVVTGGEVDVRNGTYVISGGGPLGYINVNKSLSLIGQSQAGVIIDGRNADTYALRITAPNDVTVRNFTVWGVDGLGNAYGVKVEGTHGLTMANITSQGAGKSEFDFNSVVGATLDNLTANGAPVGGGANTGGNGISFSDSQNIVLTNSRTLNNGWGGLALYQTNSNNGGSLLQETGITVAASNSFAEANPIYAEDTSAINDFGVLNIAGFNYLVKSPTNPADVYTWFRRTQQDAIDFAAAQGLTTAYVEGYGSGVTGNNVFTVGASTAGQVLSIQAALNAARSGALLNIASGTYGGNVTSNQLVNFDFGQVTLGGAFTLGAGAAGSGLSGQLTAASIDLGSSALLRGALTLTSSGSIRAGALDGAGAGGQALAVNGGAVSLGSLGSRLRLGAVQVSGPVTLTGSDYDASSLAFGGDVTLTAGSTTLDTGGAGNIVIAGSLFGSSDGAQNIALLAGAGGGGANGDISLQNVGVLGLRLGNMTIRGDNFGAQTVRVGDFNAVLTGNQVFSSHTLNADGAVNSSVGGDASGPINASQSVTFNIAGDLTGAISGTDVSLTSDSLTSATVNASGSANVSASTVTGSSVAAVQDVVLAANTMTQSSVAASQSASISASSMSGSSVTASQNLNLNAGQVTGSSFTAPTVTASATSFEGTVSASGSASISGTNISGSFSGGSFKLVGSGTVNATVDATSLAVQSPQGSVAGKWTSLDASGSSGGVLLNSQPVSLSSPGGANPSQIVVENFALPVGTTVSPRGELILPQGVVIGLLSPGGAGGAPKMIQVQTVQDLGSLLSQGYTAIVIDLSARGPAEKEDAPLKVSAR